MSAAARQLGRSQSAITKSINEIEEKIGYKLFNRTSSGVSTTIYGDALYERLRSIRSLLNTAYNQYKAYHKSPAPLGQIPLFTMDISLNRIKMLVLLGRHKKISLVAAMLNITTRTIYLFVRELEMQLDLKIFELRPNSELFATQYGDYLINRLNLVFAELRFALEHIDKLAGKQTGSICIGTAGSTRPALVPKALIQLLNNYPQIRAETREAHITELLDELSRGEIDIIVTGTRAVENAISGRNLDKDDFMVHHLFDDELIVVAGAAHPLLEKQHLTYDDLRRQKWVLPIRSMPAGQLVKTILENLSIAAGVTKIGTNSIVVLRNLVIYGDYLALLSSHQTELERKQGLIAQLDIHIPNNKWPVCAVTRNNTQPSPATSEFFKELDKVAQDYIDS